MARRHPGLNVAVAVVVAALVVVKAAWLDLAVRAAAVLVMRQAETARQEHRTPAAAVVVAPLAVVAILLAMAAQAALASLFSASPTITSRHSQAALRPLSAHLSPDITSTPSLRRQRRAKPFRLIRA